jgi:hypothetical protein
MRCAAYRSDGLDKLLRDKLGDRVRRSKPPREQGGDRRDALPTE